MTQASNTEYQQERDTLTASHLTTDIKDIFKQIAGNAYPYGITGKIIHIDADETYDRYTLQFASHEIATHFVGYEGDRKWLETQNFLKNTANNGTFGAARGILFEDYAHILLQRGGTFTVSVLYLHFSFGL